MSKPKFWITLRIEIFSSATESVYGLYTNPLRCSLKKKSKGLRSGEWGRQTYAVLKETKFPSNVMQPMGNISGGVGSRHLVESRFPLANIKRISISLCLRYCTIDILYGFKWSWNLKIFVHARSAACHSFAKAPFTIGARALYSTLRSEYLSFARAIALLHDV